MGYVRLILAAAACAIALGAFPAPASAQLLPCGLLQPCEPPPPPPPPPDGTFDGSKWSIQAGIEETELTEREPAIFTGFVTRDGGPVTVDRVELVAVPFPYGTEQVVASLTAGEMPFPSFRLTHQPRINTRYYVRTNDLDPGAGVFVVRSAVFETKVFADVTNFDTDLKRWKLSMKAAIDFPDGTLEPLSGLRMRWYIIRGKNRKIVRLGSSRIKVKPGKVLVARTRERIPRSRKGYRFFGAFCFNLAVGRDIGVGNPQRRRCP